MRAESVEAAKQINPNDGTLMTQKDWGRAYSSWCSSPNLLTVKYLGKNNAIKEAGLILASYNAG